MAKGVIGSGFPKMGRPTKYDEPVILRKTQEYIDSCVETIEEFHKTRGEKSDSYERILRVKIPKYEGLALALDIDVDTIKEWGKKHPNFSTLIKKMLAKQAEMVADGAMSGLYNPTIAKIFLSKHGYREEIDSNVNQNVNITFDSSFNQDE